MIKNQTQHYAVKPVIPLRLIRIDQVMSKIGMKQSWLYLVVNEGQFPKYISFGQRVVAWVESNITKYLDGQVDASRKQNKGGNHD